MTESWLRPFQRSRTPANAATAPPSPVPSDASGDTAVNPAAGTSATVAGGNGTAAGGPETGIQKHQQPSPTRHHRARPSMQRVSSLLSLGHTTGAGPSGNGSAGGGGGGGGNAPPVSPLLSALGGGESGGGKHVVESGGGSRWYGLGGHGLGNGGGGGKSGGGNRNEDGTGNGNINGGNNNNGQAWTGDATTGDRDQDKIKDGRDGQDDADEEKYEATFWSRALNVHYHDGLLRRGDEIGGGGGAGRGASAWHNPNYKQIVDTLQAAMMGKRDCLATLPVEYVFFFFLSAFFFLR